MKIKLISGFPQTRYSDGAHPERNMSKDQIVVPACVHEGDVYLLRGDTFGSICREHQNSWKLVSTEFSIVESESILTKIKTMLQKLTPALKKALSPTLQSQYKAGFINGGLELTEAGKSELLCLVKEDYEEKLAERAKEVIAEEEKDHA